MALLWVSGRTALLLTCASLASTLAVLNGRMMIGGVLCLLGDRFEGEIVTADDISNARLGGALVLALRDGRLESRR